MEDRDRPLRVGLIGFGAIGRLVLETLEDRKSPIEVAAILVRPERAAALKSDLAQSIAVLSRVEELSPLKLDLVAECAGQPAVAQYGEAVLRLGIDLFVISTGALADDHLRSALMSAARQAGARIVIPAGAIGGLDALNALRLGGLSHVSYTSAKPPESWRGTRAERSFDLDRLDGRTVIFRGTAREAARLYPKNANLAATVALAGRGLDDTMVELVADPGLQENVGSIEAEGRFGRLSLECRGPQAPDNPKTSAVTAFSIVHAIENRARTLVI
jgi:aspartate dehydrogenase